MSHRKFEHPRHGSLGFLPRKRAARHRGKGSYCYLRYIICTHVMHYSILSLTKICSCLLSKFCGFFFLPVVVVLNGISFGICKIFPTHYFFGYYQPDIRVSMHLMNQIIGMQFYV